MTLHTASGNKRGSAQISSAGGDEPERVAVSSATISKPKSSIGGTGAHLRYHTPEEYDNLMIEQKDELCAWHKNTQGNKKGTGRDGKDTKSMPLKAGPPTKKQVSSAVAKELKKLAKQANAQHPKDDVEVQIAALVKDAISKHEGMTPSNKLRPTLHSILKQT